MASAVLAKFLYPAAPALLLLVTYCGWLSLPGCIGIVNYLVFGVVYCGVYSAFSTAAEPRPLSARLMLLWMLVGEPGASLLSLRKELYWAEMSLCFFFRAFLALFFSRSCTIQSLFKVVQRRVFNALSPSLRIILSMSSSSGSTIWSMSTNWLVLRSTSLMRLAPLLAIIPELLTGTSSSTNLLYFFSNWTSSASASASSSPLAGPSSWSLSLMARR